MSSLYVYPQEQDYSHISAGLLQEQELATEALQVSCLLLPPPNRRCLQLLLRVMARVCQNPHLPPLNDFIATRTLVQLFAIHLCITSLLYKGSNKMKIIGVRRYSYCKYCRPAMSTTFIKLVIISYRLPLYWILQGDRSQGEQEGKKHAGLKAEKSCGIYFLTTIFSITSQRNAEKHFQGW